MILFIESKPFSSYNYTELQYGGCILVAENSAVDYLNRTRITGVQFPAIALFKIRSGIFIPLFSHHS